MTTEPADPGTRTEYAVRYDAPEKFAGTVTDLRKIRSLVDGIARHINDNQHGYHVTVVEREVTYGEWTEVSA